ncbi:hypothetical protein [Nocardia huaxiensis]|uniref:Uncharacterized protein n=1 Tax=Nocardia huaxiensis TaxID=2755382 RepID=A0A7D6VF05_9NOCA|nr:hypothetical protein [Nocardia huaxiensis]QLY31095.1 hypothetical protein H0264_01470 [Nocardia huaxiensis]UFS94622.1 hypothetical protein LPY97_28315 [Nocardia huaxiensis]
MFDPISLVVGAGLVVIGWAAGRYSRRTPRVQPPSTVCGCGHDLSLHDRKAGECHAESPRKTGWGLTVWARCGCKNYTGATPLEELFAPPVLPPLNEGK